MREIAAYTEQKSCENLWNVRFKGEPFPHVACKDPKCPDPACQDFQKALAASQIPQPQQLDLFCSGSGAYRVKPDGTFEKLGDSVDTTKDGQVDLKFNLADDTDHTTWRFVTDEEAGYEPSALDTQVGGDHYKEMGIQPVEYIHANELGFLEGNIVKYITRHKAKGKRQDIEKVIHYAQLILQLEYNEENV